MRIHLIAGLTLFVFFVVTFATHAQEKSDLKLQTVLQRAYQNNPTLMAAREELKRRQELYPQARAGWLPTISAQTSIYASDIENSNFGDADGSTTTDLSLNLEQPIWLGGRTSAEVDKARALIKAGAATLRQAEQDVFMAAITAYLNTIRDCELRKLRKKNEDILFKELGAAREQKDVGFITNTDVQQAQSRLSRAKSQYTQAETNYEISKTELEEITGILPGENLSMPYPSFNFPNTPEALFAIAERNNPEILASIFRYRASEYNADSTSSELFPQVSAFASANQQYDPQPGLVDETSNKTIGVRATLALYQGGATRSRIREARNSRDKQKYEIEETKRRIRQDVMANWRSYLSAKAQTENRKQEIEAAEQALKGVRIEASEGQRTVLDVLDADQELIDAKTSLINARRNETLAQYALAKSLGILTPANLLKY